MTPPNKKTRDEIAKLDLPVRIIAQNLVIRLALLHDHPIISREGKHLNVLRPGGDGAGVGTLLIDI